MSNPAIIAAQRRELAAREVGAMPLPGALKRGFPAPDVMVKCGEEEVTVRALCATDMAIFQQINSPFYRLQVEAAKAKKMPQMAELADVMLDYRGLIDSVFVMTRPAKVSRELIRKGITFLQDEADAKVGERWSVENIMALAGAIGQQNDTVFSTAQEFEATPDPTKREAQFFFQDSAQTAADSVGG